LGCAILILGGKDRAFIRQIFANKRYFHITLDCEVSMC